MSKVITGVRSPSGQQGFLASNWLIISILVIVIVTWIYVAAGKREQPEAPALISPGAEWVESLNVCETLQNATPGEELDACKQLGKQGWHRAQQRLAYLYSIEGDYQDWQSAFDWLALAGQHNRESELLSDILLFMLGTEPQDQENGEKGIKELANVGYPMAQAYLASIYQLGMNSLPKQANASWLMERAFEQDNSVISAYDVVRMHANGYGTRVNLDKALNVIKRYAQSNFPGSTNNVAWFLATLDDNPITDTGYPLELAKQVVEDEQHQDSYSYVDTLAAAYANHGDFKQALEVQQRASALLDAETEIEDTRKQELVEEFAERLEQYQNQDRPVYFNLYQPEETYFKQLKAAIETALLDRHATATRQP